MITENLALALRRLRHREVIRNLWADAVCVNQGDDVEKAQQAAMMVQDLFCSENYA